MCKCYAQTTQLYPYLHILETVRLIKYDNIIKCTALVTEYKEISVSPEDTKSYLSVYFKGREGGATWN